MASDHGIDRLNTPGRKPFWQRGYTDTDAFGQFAEGFARFMGTPAFLGWMTVFVVLWVTFNVVGLFGFKWDPYPFILLNLFFSTQASYSAPLILLAENRQADRDHVRIAEDRNQAEQSRADMDFLAREIASLRHSVSEMATRDYVRSELRAELEDALGDNFRTSLRKELRALLVELDARAEAQPRTAPAPRDPDRSLGTDG